VTEEFIDGVRFTSVCMIRWRSSLYKQLRINLWV